MLCVAKEERMISADTKMKDVARSARLWFKPDYRVEKQVADASTSLWSIEQEEETHRSKARMVKEE